MICGTATAGGPILEPALGIVTKRGGASIAVDTDGTVVIAGASGLWDTEENRGDSWCIWIAGYRWKTVAVAVASGAGDTDGTVTGTIGTHGPHSSSESVIVPPSTTASVPASKADRSKGIAASSVGSVIAPQHQQNQEQ